jgi:hypothetical protein
MPSRVSLQVAQAQQATGCADMAAPNQPSRRGIANAARAGGGNIRRILQKSLQLAVQS